MKEIDLRELGTFVGSILPVLLIPPSSLILWIFLGLIVRCWRRRLGNFIVGTCLVLLYVLSTPFVGGVLTRTLAAQPTQDPQGRKPGAIIILGADTELNPGLRGNAQPGPLSLARLMEGAILQRATQLPILITGGQLSEFEAPVADIMADALTKAYALPVAWRETKAQNTCQNARFSAEILRNSGVPSAYLVTHAWHMPRAVLAFERAGFPVVAASFIDESSPPLSVTDFLPHTSAWTRSYFALHEWLGLLSYRLGGCPTVSGA